MLKLCLLVSLLAVANGHWGRGDRLESSADEEELSPPNCSCVRREGAAQADVAGGKWAEHEAKWIVRFLKPNETVEQFKARKADWKKVCATDGMTYADQCEFINKASAIPSLGKRCHGSCPCEFKEEERFNHSRKHFRQQQQHQGRPICLNNGTTVYGYEALQAVVKSDASIGSRCKGECSECATQLKCPHRHRHDHRGELVAGLRGRHHFESNVTAPNCTCTVSDAPWDLAFRNSSCGRKRLELRRICGSDGVTYANKCDFKNTQSRNVALGKRCHGACPCDFAEEKETFSRHHNSSAKFSSDRRDFFGKKSRKAFCLNNGVTVYGWSESRAALIADSKVGVRCKGECSECQAAPIKCPVDWVKIWQEKEASRPKPPNCKCPKALQMGFGRHHRGREICGNDNKTYANICELVNNQSSQAGLGFRCLGKCPCKNQTAVLDRIPKIFEDASVEGEEENGFDESAEKHSFSDHAGSNNSISAAGSKDSSSKDLTDAKEEDEEPLNDDHMEENFDGDDEVEEGEGAVDAGSNSTDDWGHRHRHHRHHHGHRHHRHHRHRRHHHRRHHWFHRRSICLTNGETVKGWRNVSEAFKADPSVGIRCRGHCEYCANITHCPWFPSEEKQKEIRTYFHHKMQEKGRKWLEMTVESAEKPGQCDCSWGFHGKNKSNDRKENDWGHRGHHMHKMDFSVCSTDNVTYKSICELTNAQATDKNLGFRCHGACPCPVEVVEDELEDDDNSTESQNFKRYLTEHGQKFAFCLTNGKTVFSKRELKAALAADPKLGTRYMNDCSVGDAGLKCPRVFRPMNGSEFHFGGKFGNSHGGMERNGTGGEWQHKSNGKDRRGDEGRKGHGDEWRKGHGDEWRKGHADNRTVEERREEWELKKQSPSFEFIQAFDFGYGHVFGGFERHRGGRWGRWGEHRRHHEGFGRRSQGWTDSCEDEHEDGQTGNSTVAL